MSSQTTDDRQAEKPPPAPDESVAAVDRSPRTDKSRKRRRRGNDVASAASVDCRESQDTLAAAERVLPKGAHCESLGLPKSLLLEISAAFTNRQQCIFLAVKLKFGEDEVFKLFNTPFSDSMAYTIMTKWIDVDRHATGPVLHAALCEIEQDLGEQFKERLLVKAFQAKSGTEVSGAAGLSPTGPESGASVDVCPSWDLLHQIAGFLPKRKHSVQLAQCLGLGKDYVKRLKEGLFMTSRASLNVLHTWRHEQEKRATGKVLFYALNAIKKRDVAVRFGEELLGQVADEKSRSMSSADSAGSGATAEMCPSWDLLHQIAGFLPKRKHSVQLAQCLGLGKDYVKRLKEGMFMTSRASLNVLHTWRHEQETRATGNVLFYALTAIKKRDVAVRFGEELLGRALHSPQSADDRKGQSPHSDDSAGAQRTDDATFGLSDNLLLEISAAFSDKDQCISLAVTLKIIGQTEVLKMLWNSTFNDRLAYRIMQKWAKGNDQQATGPALYSALRAIEDQDFADQFKERLLGRDLIGKKTQISLKVMIHWSCT